MEKICIVDTSIATDNIGDEIIMDAVDDFVWSRFPNAFIHRVPSHEPLTARTRRFVYDADWCFIGGTNLLSSKLSPLGLWRVDHEDALIFGSTRTVLLGVGWNDYQPTANPYTRRFLLEALAADLQHSVRDRYTRDQLRKVGVAATSTSCVTTWGLTPEQCAKIPKDKAPSAVVSLTCWRADPQADGELLKLMKSRYDKVYFFPQQSEDYAYLHDLGFGDLPLAATTKESYNHFLESEEVDVVGTRLHGGIRALQKGRRSLILAVDNRAAEISRDIGLPVLPRTETAAISGWIDTVAPTRLELPQAQIDAWRAQFSNDQRVAVAKPARAAPPKPDWKTFPPGLQLVGKLRRIALGLMG